MSLKQLRKEHRLTQKKAADLIGVPYRTYIRYESDPKYEGTFRYRMIYKALTDQLLVDESHGLLTIEIIKQVALPILSEVGIKYCYLFGSYAKGNPSPKSDVDLLVDTDLTGFAFFDLTEKLRNALRKKVDLLRLDDLQSDNPIALEILKDGIRIL